MRFILTIGILLAGACQALGSEWIFMSSVYTHKDGQRVTQYAKPKPAYVHKEPMYHRFYNHRDSDGRYYLRETWYNYPHYSHYDSHYDYWRTPHGLGIW